MGTPPGASRRLRRVPVTALFDSPEAVERALERLGAAGLPRDLIEVAVNPSAAETFYSGRGSRSARDTFRYAGIGGILGLLLGAAFSILLIALPGFQDPGLMAWVQLIGPNVATIGGALLGAIVGFFVRRAPSPWHTRLAGDELRILVAALARSDEEIGVVERVLAETGGKEVQAA